MFDPISIFLIFIALVDLGLGIFVYQPARQNRGNIFFGLFAVCLAGWTATMIGFRTVENSAVAIAWMQAAYVIALFAALAFWYFALNFPNPRRLHPFVNTLHVVGTVVFAILIATTSVIVEGIKYETWGRAVYQNPIGWYIYAFYFIVFFLGGHLLLIWKYFKATGIDKVHLRFVFSAVFLGGEVFGVFFNLILPSPIFDQWRLIWVGPLLTTTFMLPIVGYAFAKHKLMHAKVITAEVFTILITLLSFINIFTYRTLGDLILRVSVFVGILIFSVVIIWGVIREVKRREEMERLKNELEIAYAKLQELDQAKTDFLSMASHQLRSPLTVVRLGLAALLDGTFGKIKDQRQIDAMNKMAESATRLINLIGEYLNVSRIELGKMKYNFKEQDLCALVKDIVEEYQPRAKQKGLKLMYGTTPSPSLGRRGKPLTPALSRGERGIPLVTFDEEKMRHVIVNLIDNALKYTNTGKIEVKCEVEGEPLMVHNSPPPPLNLRGGENGGWVKVSVKDTGLGLDQDDIAVLFQKFRRAAGGTLRMRQGEPIEGSGLGLHVAKMFVEKHGGKIWAQSEGRGKGSTFIFTLPLSGPPPLDPEEMGEGGKGVELPR